MDTELTVLEHKLALLIAQVHALRESNASLQHELARSRERNRLLAQRMQAASTRLDTLLERLPEG